MEATPTTRGVGERLFEAQEPTIERIVRRAAVRYRLRDDERQELYSQVMLRVVEGDFAVLRRFRGTSRWTTYLTVVVHRVLLDLRASAWGRWRPSARARRLGVAAVALERALERDGLAVAEAVRIAADADPSQDTRTLRRLADQLPRRQSRREVYDEVALAQVPGGEASDRRVDDDERSRAARAVRRTLAAAWRDLSEVERRWLGLRFARGWPVRRIAESAGLDPRRFYRRFAWILRRMRRRFERAGLDWRHVAGAIGAEPDAEAR